LLIVELYTIWKTRFANNDGIFKNFCVLTRVLFMVTVIPTWRHDNGIIDVTAPHANLAHTAVSDSRWRWIYSVVVTKAQCDSPSSTVCISWYCSVKVGSADINVLVLAF